MLGIRDFDCEHVVLVVSHVDTSQSVANYLSVSISFDFSLGFGDDLGVGLGEVVVIFADSECLVKSFCGADSHG